MEVSNLLDDYWLPKLYLLYHRRINLQKAFHRLVDTMFYTEMRLPNVAKFVYHFVKAKDLASMNAGSAVPSMTTDILNAMEVAIPSASALEEFEALVSPMYKTMQENDNQSETLAKLRDALLPKLMSGEIDVSGIQL